MRVFILSTGRAGTTTFTKASEHITNYTAAHESTRGMFSPDHLDFPDRHIESNPYLTFLLAPLAKRLEGQDVFFVHLQRKREGVIQSWLRRGPKIGPGKWSPIAMGTNSRQLNRDQFEQVCGLCHDAMVGQVEAFLARIPADQQMHIWLHEAAERWPVFWQKIGAEGDLAAATAEWSVRHNKGK
mgnify:CR=1 FL=1